MAEIAFVFPSTHVTDTEKLFKGYTDLEFDSLYLCSDPKPKILKKDVDLDLTSLDKYKVVCPVGAEPLKYVCGLTGITKYNGILTNGRYLPLINPTLVEFRPQYKDDIIKACLKLKEIKEGNISTEVIEKDYEYITKNEDFEKFLVRLRNSTTIILDSETTSLSPYQGEVIGITITIAEHQAVFVDHSIVEKYKNELQECFDNAKCVFHNAKFDVKFFKHDFGFKFDDFDDTMLLHYCLEEAVGTHGLKPLALKWTDLGDYDRDLDEYKKSWCRKNKVLLRDFNFGMLPIEILVPYAQKDGDATQQLYNKFNPLVRNSEKFSWVYDNILIPGTKALIQLEENGGPIDVDALIALNDNYDIDIEECIDEIKMDEDVQRFERIEGKDFNPNSTAQLQRVLFDIKKLTPIKKTEGGKWSVDKEVLGALSEEDSLVDAVLDLREKVKLQGTYIKNILNGLDTDKRLRSNFNIHGTTSGRLSSSGTLNYQNIPRDNKDIKKLFVARPGYKIVQGDLGTAEVYYAAVLSGDKFLQRAFIEKLDFHSYIAKQIFNLPCKVEEVADQYFDQRQYSKAITFGIMYQAGPAKVAETANISFTEAKQFINKYFNEARQLKTFINASNIFIENNAYIYSFFGRKRRLPESRSPNQGVAKHAVRSGVNFLVQSVASDINMLGLIVAMDWIKDEGLQEDIIPFTIVHDSIVAEVKDDLVETWGKKLTEFIQIDRGLSIPDNPIKFDLEVGRSWGELKKFVI